MLQKRLPHIDLLKTIAIFFVVLYHSTCYSYNFLVEENLIYYFLYFIRTILSTCVPLFFFANGYLLFSKDFDLRKHILKIIKLIVITVIWGAITLVSLQVIKQEYFSVFDFIKAIWTWKQGWINHLWYMGALICIYVFFPILKEVYDKNKKLFYYFTIISGLLTFGNKIINIIATVGLDLILEKSIALETVNFFNIFNPFRGWFGYSIVYFCVGGIMYYFKDKIETISIKKRNVISVLGILLSCLGLYSIGIIYTKITGSIWDVVWNGYDTIFTFFNVIFIYLLCLNWKVDDRFVKTLSSNTLGIYFIHGIIINIIKPYLIEYEFLKNLPFNLIFVFIILIICCGICFVLKKIPIVSNLVNKL